MTTNEKHPLDPAALLRGVLDLQITFEAALTLDEHAAVLERTAEGDAPSTVDLPPPVYSIGETEEALEDFTLTTALESLQSLTGQVQALVDQKMEAAYRMALDVYYAAEELSRDPEHAHLAAHVENMRRAHESQYGRTIPPRG